MRGISRLKDRRVGLSERLLLARKLYGSDGVVIPNKHQVIYDAIASILINNRKSQELSQSSLHQVWQTLSDLCGGVGDDGDPSHLALRPSTAVRPVFLQVVVECLERERGLVCNGGGEGLMVEEVLTCCVHLFTASALSGLVSTHFHLLVNLSAVLCKLAMLPSTTIGGLQKATDLLLVVTSAFRLHHHRVDGTSSQTLSSVIDCSLQPAMCLAYCRRDDSRLIAGVDRFVGFLIEDSLLHRSQEKALKMFLEDNFNGKSCLGSVKDSPINCFFRRIESMLKPSDVSPGQVDDDGGVGSKAATSILLRFFKSFFCARRSTGEYGFKLLVVMLSYLGVERPPESNVDRPSESAQGIGVLPASLREDHLEAVVCLLAEAKNNRVYSVLVDRASGERQAKYFMHLLACLMNSGSSTGCQCICVLLDLNHLIVEPRLLDVFLLCSRLLQEEGGGSSGTINACLMKLVVIYSDLHQLPKFFTVLLEFCENFPDRFITVASLPWLSSCLAEQCNLTNLTCQTLLSLITMLQDKLLGFVASSNQTPDSARLSSRSVKAAWAVSVLFHRILCSALDGAPVMEQQMPGALPSLLRRLTKDFVFVLLNDCTNLVLIKSALLMATCLLRSAPSGICRGDHPLKELSSFPQECRLGLSATRMKKLRRDSVCRLLLDSYHVWKSMKSGEMPHFAHLMSGLWSEAGEEEGVIITQEQIQSTWDGDVISVNSTNFCVAKLNMIGTVASVFGSSVLVSGMVGLVDVLVQVFAYPSGVECNAVQLSCHSEARRLVQLLCSEEMLGADRLVCGVWRRLAADVWSSPLASVLSDLAQAATSDVAKMSGDVRTLLLTLCAEDRPHVSPSSLSSLWVLDEVRILHLPESVFLRCMLGLMAVSAWVGWEDGDGAASTAVPRFCNVLCRFMVVAQIKAPPQLASPPYDAFLARLLPAALSGGRPTRLLELSVRASLSDSRNVPVMAGFVSDVCGTLRRLGGRERALSVVHQVLQTLLPHLKRGDDACTANSLFSTIAEAIVEAAELSTGPLPQSPLEMWAGEIGDGGPGAESLPHGLLRCVECVLVGSCAVMPKRGCLPIPLSATVEAVFWRLQVVRLDVRGQQPTELIAAELMLIITVFHHRSVLQSWVTEHLASSVFKYLLCSPHHGLRFPDWQPPERTSPGFTNGALADDARRTADGTLGDDGCCRERGGGTKRKLDRKCSPLPKKARVPNMEDSAMDQMVPDLLTPEFAKTLVTIVVSCSPTVFVDLLQPLLSSVVPIRGLLLFWQELVICTAVRREQKEVVESLSLQVLHRCVGTLQAGCREDEQDAALSCASAMLHADGVLSTKGCGLSLVCCLLVIGATGRGGHAGKGRAVVGVADVLRAVLVRHPIAGRRHLATVVGLATSMLKMCIELGDQDLLSQQADLTPMAVDCAEAVARVLSLMFGQRSRLMGVAGDVVADFTTKISSLTLLPAVKKRLLPGLYACLNACDKRSVERLRRGLPTGVRDSFNAMYEEFDKYYKYRGGRS